MDTLTLREAADLCETTVKAMRNRADRGTIATVTRDGQRFVPLAELERAGLLPDSEVRKLRQEVEQLRGELATSRLLVESTERAAAAEREAHERLVVVVAEREAAVRVAQASTTVVQHELEEERDHQQRLAAELAERDAQARTAQAELQSLEDNLRAAGPIRAWKLARARRRATEAA